MAGGAGVGAHDGGLAAPPGSSLAMTMNALTGSGSMNHPHTSNNNNNNNNGGMGEGGYGGGGYGGGILFG